MTDTTIPELSLCPECNCMTKTLGSKCGKCKGEKIYTAVRQYENLANILDECITRTLESVEALKSGAITAEEFEIAIESNKSARMAALDKVVQARDNETGRKAWNHGYYKGRQTEADHLVVYMTVNTSSRNVILEHTKKRLGKIAAELEKQSDGSPQ